MKKTIFIYTCIGMIVGLMLAYLTYFGLSITSGEKFCVICHEMDPMVMAYKDDVHGGAGKLGANTACVDCHIPHDNLIKYIFVKARNGVVEGAHHFSGSVDNFDWVANMKNRENYVFDDGCLKCHGNILDFDLVKSSKQALKMHKHYEKLKGSDKEIKCAYCHFDAGHKNLKNYINYYHPEHKFYKEQMDKKRLEAIEKFKKYGIDSSELK